jgi:hypothetical protein
MDNFEVNAFEKQQGRGGMAQVVEAKFRQLRSGE